MNHMCFKRYAFIWIYRVNKNALVIDLILQVLLYVTRYIRSLDSIASTGYTKKNTNFWQPICVKEKLGVALRYLASGDSQQSVGWADRISKAAISK